MTGSIKSAPAPDMQSMNIAVRAYVCRNDPPKKAGDSPSKKSNIPSEWVLVLDAETTTDASQKLRFGTYQIRKGGALIQAGIFYDPETLSDAEKITLQSYAETHGLTLLSVAEFIEDVFFRVGYDYRASIIGFNLPFDISRLALDHAPARVTKNKIMRGGFSFKLSDNPKRPRVQVKHISSRDSFIQFAATRRQRATRGDRKKKRPQPVRRGCFIDIKTLAAALMSKSHSLASLAKALDVAAQKHDTQDHGRALTPEYIAYAVQDTQTTWECFVKLKSLYESHGLSLTEAHTIHSEASLGKAYLREMGIKSWREMQPDFPPYMTGIILSAYYGGRSEVHIRCDITQVLYCDFLSMYPTVCTLMGLWRFVTAQGMTWQDTTSETQKLLDEITLSDLRKPEAWRSLNTIVQLKPNGDIFPVRSKYGGDAQYTIGSNHLTSEMPLYFTLADCFASKLLTGQSPKILQAFSFVPGSMQDGLKPVHISGNAAYRVDPCEGDFFRQVIDLRSAVKTQLKAASDIEKPTLESQQHALKTLANSTSYGIFVELNVEEEKHLQPMLCYGPSGKAMPIEKKKFEKPGSFFHPVLATFITGGARLKLAIAERLAMDAGLDWAFCDTDSMALAKPEGMSENEFYARAQKIQGWFIPLNPYADNTPLLKIEDYNYRLPDKKTFEPLYCYAISSKRYALFNLDANGEPVLRKVSAHGLGHLIAPYQRDDKSDLGDAQPWQQDFWLEIIKAALQNNHAQPDFQKLKNFNMPAVSRYGATTPALLKWFDKHNENKAYRDRVRPFNFSLTMQAQMKFQGRRRNQNSALRPVAPFDKNLKKSVTQCFDRNTGEKVNKSQLKTYLDVLAQYHMHPETKFLNGDYLDRGFTKRRHVFVKAIQHIGKEANKWEEQIYAGYDPTAQLEYGICDEQKTAMLEAVLQAIKMYGTSRVAATVNLSERHVLKIYKKETVPSGKALMRLHTAVKILENSAEAEKSLLEQTNEMMRAKNISIRSLAAELDIDPSNLAKILSGRRANAELLNHTHVYLTKLVD